MAHSTLVLGPVISLALDRTEAQSKETLDRREVDFFIVVFARHACAEFQLSP